MASGITSDGKTVTVTTDEGHRIGFGMAELNANKTSGDITTKWNGGVPPTSTERTVAAAKIDAETYSAQNHASAPGDARSEQNRDKGIWSIFQSLFGLQWHQKSL